MFTAAEREGVRGRLLSWAGADPRITGAAITGSGALGREDEWSDVDLLFGIEGADPSVVLADWTYRLRDELGALHLFDLCPDSAVYGVFLLPNGLEVDVAFAPATDFGSYGATFRTVFGTPVERQPPPRTRVEHLIGLGCHHALHARACIERGKVWQAEHVIHALRDHIVALACTRHGLESYFGREIDRLPVEVMEPLQDTLLASVEPAALRQALDAAIGRLLVEIWHAQPGLAEKIEPILVSR
jgi:hypothetical protein